MARFHGGVISDEEKAVWEAIAKEESFDNLWAWIRWVIRKYVKENASNR